MKPRTTVAALFKYLFLILFALTTLYPLVWVLLSSFKLEHEIFGNPFGLPSKWIFRNYVDAWNGARIGTTLLNSVAYSSVSVAVLLLLTSMTSYVLAKVRPNKALYFYFTLGIMIPIHAIIIPLAIFARTMGIINTRPGIVFMYVISQLSFSIFILVSFMRTIPTELEYAAAIDGCSRYGTFFHIILPVSKTGLATVGTFGFLYCWNDLFLALVFLAKQSLLTLNISVYRLRAQYIHNYALISAGIIMVVLPVFIMYIFFQEQIIRGMTAGAIKG